MKKENDPHPVYINLRDWSKAKKGNRPVAKIHSKRKESQNGKS